MVIKNAELCYQTLTIYFLSKTILKNFKATLNIRSQSVQIGKILWFWSCNIFSTLLKQSILLSPNLITETKRSRQGKSATRLSPAEFCEIFSLQLHHDVVEPVVPAATDEPADVFPALKLLQDGHFHLQHLLRLLGRLQLESNLDDALIFLNLQSNDKQEISGISTF